MKRIYLLATVFCLLISLASQAQTYNGNPYKRKVNPTKNVILMIPDGTSIGVVSAARWYKQYNGMGTSLNIDPYISGTVKTYCSNAPIGDSAPTTSCYMTGMPAQTGNVAMYPVADKGKDLVEVDASMAYQPLATLLEAMRIEQKKSTGLVVTVEYPHATPGDCSAHHYQRSRYDLLGSQMAYQNLDVMFGGGTKLVTDDMKQHFGRQQTSYYADDISAFRKHKTGKVWALWGEMDMPYAIDRDTSLIPSLAEMTGKAIDLLSQNKDGFFLMVEGSKVDWMAHANDAVGCITEFIEFDNAVGKALEFAKKDGNTTVVILPDHGNSGFTIGRRDLEAYDKASIDDLFATVSKYKRTAEGLEQILLKSKQDDFRTIIKQYTDIDITDDELTALIQSENYKPENYMKVSDGKNMISKLTDIMNKRTYFGFTTGGHTGEEVFLAAYHPQGQVPVGFNTNIEINHYMADVSGISKRLPELTSDIFAKHSDVFKGLNCTIDKSNPDFPVLTVSKGKNKLVVPAFKSVAYLNGKLFDIGSVTVYIDKTDTFYLSRSLLNKL